MCVRAMDIIICKILHGILIGCLVTLIMDLMNDSCCMHVGIIPLGTLLCYEMINQWVALCVMYMIGCECP